MNKTESLGCRVSRERLKAIDAAAQSDELTRTQWLEIAIARQLGKRPRVPLAARVARLEKQIEQLLPDSK